MRKRLLAAVLAVAAAGCSRGPGLPKSPRGEAAVKVSGAVESGPFFLDGGALAQLPQRTVKGVDPQTGRGAAYQGAALHELLARLKLKRGADTVVVRTADGEAIPIPVWIVLQMKPVLADHADGTSLPDRILAWPNVEQQGLDTDPRAHQWWARRVVALELADWQRMFGPALRAPPGAADSARLGAGQYGLRCVACHRVRGVGGTKGPELTRAGDRLDAGRFARAVEQHPGFADGARRTGAPAGAVVDQVWAFLWAVARSGPPVAEDAAEPEEPPEDRPPLRGGPLPPGRG